MLNTIFFLNLTCVRFHLLFHYWPCIPNFSFVSDIQLKSIIFIVEVDRLNIDWVLSIPIINLYDTHRMHPSFLFKRFQKDFLLTNIKQYTTFPRVNETWVGEEFQKMITPIFMFLLKANISTARKCCVKKKIYLFKCFFWKQHKGTQIETHLVELLFDKI